MACSGATALAIGFLFGAAPARAPARAVFWGVTVVADSAQFSTAISELAPPGTAGSALAIQTALGFILTGVTILGSGSSLRPTARLAGRLVAPRARTARGHRRDVASPGPSGRDEDGQRPPLTTARPRLSAPLRDALGAGPVDN